MNEQEAIEILTLNEQMKKKLSNLKDVYEVAVSALQEIQQYRSIGTVEECREAMEKNNGWLPGMGDLISRKKVMEIITPRLNSCKIGSLEYQRLYSILEELEEK